MEIGYNFVLKSQFYLHARAQKGKICRKRWGEINVGSSVIFQCQGFMLYMGIMLVKQKIFA